MRDMRGLAMHALMGPRKSLKDSEEGQGWGGGAGEQSAECLVVESAGLVAWGLERREGTGASQRAG